MPIVYPRWLLRILSLVAFSSLLTLPATAQIRTLTDQLGRTINAEVISVDGDTVKIRRADGQLFDMPLANLSDDDQIALKKWAKANPAPPPAEEKTQAAALAPGSVTMNLSRGKFTVDVAYQSSYSKDSYEEWGYNVQLTNTTLRPIENLRVEYSIFGRLYSGSTVSRESGAVAVEVLGAKKSTTFRTKSFRLNKWRSTDGSFNYQGGLHGIWARLYAGDTLLQEYVSPESLRNREEWKSPQK